MTATIPASRYNAIADAVEIDRDYVPFSVRKAAVEAAERVVTNWEAGAREVQPPYNHEVLAAIVAQRELGWPDFHPENYCHRCGGINPSWSIDSDRFNVAMGPYGPNQWNGIICVGCFAQLHEAATGLHCTWQLTPLTNFRPIEVTP